MEAAKRKNPEQLNFDQMTDGAAFASAGSTARGSVAADGARRIKPAPLRGAGLSRFSRPPQLAGAAELPAAPSSVPPLSNRGVKCAKNKIAGVALNKMKFAVSADGGTAFSLFGSWSSDFLKTLERFKCDLKIKGFDSGKIGVWGVYEIKLYAFGVRPSSGQFPAAYILDVSDSSGLCFKIYLSSADVDSLPVAFVQLHYSALRNHCLYNVVQEVKSLLNDWGLKITRLSMSRLDVNVTCNLPIDYFVAEMRAGRVLLSSRKRRFIANGQKVETFDCGSRGDCVVLRVYDKIAELQSNFDPLKVEDIQSTFKNDSSVTRFEFEFCRRVLREHNIDCEDDLISGLEPLLQWCLSKVFRMVKKVPKNNRHLDRLEYTPFFVQLSAAFMNFARSLMPGILIGDCFLCSADNRRRLPEVSPRVRRPFRRRASTILKSGLSTVVTALSRLTTAPLPIEKLFRVVFDSLYKQNKTLYNRYRMRFADAVNV